MKKFLKQALTLGVIILIVLSMSSCGIIEITDIESSTNDEYKTIVPFTKDNNTTPDAEGPKTDEYITKTPEITTDIFTNEPDTTIPDTEDEKDPDVEIEETICFEYKGVIVKAKEIVEDVFLGTGIKIYVENNSEKDYIVGAEAVIVNNYMVDELFSVTVAAGKKANEVLYLSNHDLKESGIENIGQIEVYFSLVDSESYDTEYESECVNIKTNFFDKMDTVAENTGYTLLEKDGIKIVGKYVDENTIFGTAIVLYIENNTDSNITLSCEDFSINGYMVSSFFYQSVYKGKCAISEITILESDLEDNDITEITDFELKFEVYDSDTYDVIIKTDALKFSIK